MKYFSGISDAQIQGCLWHLCRAFLKKANKLRILRYRRAVPAVLVLIRQACAIALLPQALFNEALNILRDKARNENVVAAYLLWPFFQYVEDKWLNVNYRRRWMAFYKAAHRTNNACETHNRMLRTAVGAYRPNIFLFIEAIARLEHNANLDIDLMRLPEEARRTRRWQSVYTDRQLEMICNDLEMDIFHDRDDTIWNFITTASLLFQKGFDGHVQREVGRVQRQV